jgi:Zn-dependent peptidase ImmA (M78 family)
MNRKAYYRNMQALALEVRKRHGLRRADISIKQMWRVYRAEGIERIDFWPNLRHIRAAYFNDECGVSVMLAKGLPDEPTIFSMAHELKHHLVDRDLMVTLCEPTDDAVIADDRNAIEIGADVFAAEFIHPEADFVRDLEKIGSPSDPKALVRLKEATSTSLSYQAMVKRSLRLGLLHYTDELRFEGVRWGLLEKRLFGRRLSDARRQQRLGRHQQA